MKKILSIGNSFGVDATRYLYSLARAGGERIKMVSLFIGGCPLSLHHENMITKAKAYELYLNGANSGFKVSLEEALLSDEWDVVTFQQVSTQSGNEESFYPYLTELVDYVKKLAPTASHYIHQTWAYPENSEMYSLTPFKTRAEMTPCIKHAYESACKKVGAKGLIPCLNAMELLYREIGDKLYRDGLHASYGIGRYLLGCVWYAVIMGKTPVGNSFCDLDEPANPDLILLAQKCAEQAVLEYGYILE